MGMTPPMHWPMPVASAAPASPQWKTAMNSASSTMFATPAAMTTSRPTRGRSATTRKLWNTFCSMNAVVNAMLTRP